MYLHPYSFLASYLEAIQSGTSVIITSLEASGSMEIEWKLTPPLNYTNKKNHFLKSEQSNIFLNIWLKPP